jgi:ATP-dependent Clp protease ATP-binding subunit ClpA
LLREGTDLKYGARHLKRAIDRALVHPLSNLIATQQVRGGDLIRVDFDYDAKRMTFAREAEDLPTSALARMMSGTVIQPNIAG